MCKFPTSVSVSLTLVCRILFVDVNEVCEGCVINVYFNDNFYAYM